MARAETLHKPSAKHLNDSRLAGGTLYTYLLWTASCRQSYMRITDTVIVDIHLWKSSGDAVDPVIVWRSDTYGKEVSSKSDRTFSVRKQHRRSLHAPIPVLSACPDGGVFLLLRSSCGQKSNAAACRRAVCIVYEFRSTFVRLSCGSEGNTLPRCGSSSQGCFR
eukprot:6189489-Pleurochrysis_carterae.AAC.2